MKLKYLFIIIIVIFVFEIIIRNITPVINKSDEVLGWRLLPNLNVEMSQKSLTGKKYEVKFITNSRGSRFYGKEENSDVKILIMGDSMTNGPYASNDKMWFSIFGKKLESLLNKKVYLEVIGSGGYGTLQQYLLSKKIKKNFDPDFLIIQFCDNDFYNNTYEWESIGITRNQYVRRPYILNDNIFYYSGYLKYFYKSYFFENFRTLNRADLLFTVIQSLILHFVFNQSPGMSYVDDDKNILNLQKKSIQNTDLILSKIKEEFYNKDIYIFNLCDFNNKYPFNTWKKISKKNDLIVLDFFNDMSFNEESYYKDTRHFNNNGNLEIGNKLFNKIIEIGKIK
tara:strand:+ start:77 stop:1093 length:1017 start_codon:yes stop_codon:yes gene_type:complete